MKVLSFSQRCLANDIVKTCSRLGFKLLRMEILEGFSRFVVIVNKVGRFITFAILTRILALPLL